MMSGATSYEVWARRLRQWAKDPDTPLADLPSMANDSYITKDSMDRLVDHILKAINSFMDLFSKKVDEAFDAPDLHELAQRYHNLQYFYAKRLMLSRHPGLPAELSRAMVEGAETDLRSIQKQLEEAASKQSGRGSIGAGVSDVVMVVRNNSLLQILNSTASLTPTQGTGCVKQQVSLIPTYDPNAN